MKADDYPAEALDNGEEGSVTVRLTVNERGEVSGCEVETSSGSPSLDAQTCTIASTRAKFEPAKDSSGRPAIGEFRQRVTWKLEDEVESPPAATSPELSRIAAQLPKASKSAVLLNRTEIARSMDYPQEALQQNLEGSVRVRLLVDQQGQVAGCWLIKSSSHDILDAQTCDLLIAKAKYRPARDRRGRAVASLTDRQLIWRIASPDKIPPNWALRITAVVGPVGEVRSCKGESFYEGSWHESSPTMCKDVSEGDPRIRLAFREKSKLHDAVLVIETRALTEASETMPNVGRRHGEVLLALRSVSMKFAPDGTRVSCLMLESIGLEGQNDVCSEPADKAVRPPQELLGKTGIEVRYLSAIYLTGEPDPSTEQ